MRKKAAILFLCLLFCCNKAHPDVSTDIVTYRENKELNYIEISSNIVLGEAAVDYLEKNKEQMEKQGVFQQVWFSEPEQHIREAKFKEQKIKTVITMFPPAGRGAGGGVPTQNVEIFIDGRKKIDCTIGSNSRKGIVIDRIIMHIDPKYGLFDIIAHTVFDKFLSCPSGWQWFEDKNIITDSVLLGTSKVSGLQVIAESIAQAESDDMKKELEAWADPNIIEILASKRIKASDIQLLYQEFKGTIVFPPDPDTYIEYSLPNAEEALAATESLGRTTTSFFIALSEEDLEKYGRLVGMMREVLWIDARHLPFVIKHDNSRDAYWYQLHNAGVKKVDEEYVKVFE